MPRLLTKSKFLHYFECPCRTWVEIFHPRLMPPIDAGLQKIFDDGNDVDFLSRDLHKGGVEVPGFNETGFENTKQAIEGGAKILYQPTAVANQLSARGDILVQARKKGWWDLYEVKSSTKVKDEHIFDLAFQKICFEGAGIKINKTYLYHINNAYIRQGKIQVKQLMTKVDLTAEVAANLDQTKKLIEEAKEVLQWKKELTPEQIMSCQDLQKCHWPWFWLDSLPQEKRDALLEQLPAELLTPSESVKKQIDKQAVRHEIDQLAYPLYFLDYETYSSAIPPFDGTRPYQQIPFQFSVYKIEHPNAAPEFVDFLAEEFNNPVPQLVAALEEAIGPEGTVISWFAPFEKKRNEEMAEQLSKKAGFLLGLNDRMFDLMQIFKQGHYIDPDFGGSNSIKAVMPVLVPDLSYKNLAIQEGGVASASWPKLTKLPKGSEERKQLRQDMIDYCRLDVYGMVKILDVLREKVY